MEVTSRVQLSKGGQLTLDKMLGISQHGQGEQGFVDRYAELRRFGIKVFDQTDIAKQPPLKQKFLQFMNDESLRLLHSKKMSKGDIDAQAKMQWNLRGKKEALQTLGRDAAENHNTDVDKLFGDYKRKTEIKQTEVQEIQKYIEDLNAALIEKSRKGTISRNEKQTTCRLLKELEEKKERKFKELNLITTNWGQRVRKVETSGPPKPRGRKRKHKVALEQKEVGESSNDTHDSEDDTASKNLEEMDIESKMFVPVNNLKLLKQVIKTSQNSFATVNEGSSSCVEISLLLAGNFLHGKFDLPSISTTTDDLENLDTIAFTQKFIPFFENIIQEGVLYWRENGLPPMTASSAIQLSLLECFNINSPRELFWNTQLGVGGEPTSLCLSLIKETLESGKKSSLLFTLNPDKSFIVLIDEMGTMLLADSHIHYATIEQTFEEARLASNSGSLILLGKHPESLVDYIFGQLPIDLRCNHNHGLVQIITTESETTVNLLHPKSIV